MKQIFNYIKPFLFATFCFLLTIILIKTIEAFTISAEIDFGIYMRSIATNIIVSGITCICILPIFIGINFLSKKGALLTTSILLSFVILAEISLAVYTAHNGTLLGAELLVRPAEESLMAVKGAFGIIVPIISVIAIITGFTTIVMLLSRLNMKVGIHISALVVILLSIPCIFFSKYLLTENSTENNYISNKIYFLANDCISYINAKNESEYNANVEYNKEYIDTYINDNPEFSIPDTLYPMERIDKTPDVLSEYFNTSDVKPNIVLIIVESLGHEFMDPCVAPFVDSLAQTGLYWPNCLSTTTRSFGAVPAITGSVTGPKGFQFGTMPQHNSIISTLSNNGYQTNVFYGGDLSFDCVYEYLNSQHIDYVAPFWNEYSNSKDKSNGNWWGYYDKTLFDKSLEIIKSHGNKPKFNLFITLTNHEDLKLKDKNEEQKIINATEEIIKTLNSSGQEFANKHKGRCACVLYSDNCIKNFFYKYKETDDFKNTIFIITGDHASGIVTDNRLSFHHVPLIIWSPLLNTHRKFPSIVTHNDIAPSICKLLQNKYGITLPSTTHSIGKGLNTSDQMEKKSIMPIINYAHVFTDMVYNKYYYESKSKWMPQTIYEIDDNLNMTIVNDSIKQKQLEYIYDSYKYVINYTYSNNKLTKNPIYSQRNAEIIDIIRHNGDLICETPAEMPSKAGRASFPLIQDYEIDTHSKNFGRVCITLDMDIFVNDSLWIDQYMDLIFTCDNSNPVKYEDKIVKFINEDVIHKDSTYHLNLSKEFILDKDYKNKISVNVSSVKYDDAWVPNSKLTIKNTSIKIEGVLNEN